MTPPSRFFEALPLRVWPKVHAVAETTGAPLDAVAAVASLLKRIRSDDMAHTAIPNGGLLLFEQAAGLREVLTPTLLTMASAARRVTVFDQLAAPLLRAHPDLGPTCAVFRAWLEELPPTTPEMHRLALLADGTDASAESWRWAQAEQGWRDGVVVVVGLPYPDAESFLPSTVRAHLGDFTYGPHILGRWPVLRREDPLSVALATLYPALRTPSTEGLHVVVISHGTTFALVPTPTAQDETPPRPEASRATPDMVAQALEELAALPDPDAIAAHLDALGVGGWRNDDGFDGPLTTYLE